VGVLEATNRPVTQTDEFLGRISATNRVSVIARVTAFLDKRTFTEGTEVKAGDEFYQLERGSFEADLAAVQALYFLSTAPSKLNPERRIAVPSRLCG
jgi:membrane fusion protein, multidrug efflux system